MAQTQRLMGVQHKEGEFLNEKTRSMQKYNNILLYRSEEFGEEEIAFGLKTPDELKVKYDEFESIARVDPAKFLAECDQYVGKRMIVYFDEKLKPMLIEFKD